MNYLMCPTLHQAKNDGITSFMQLHLCIFKLKQVQFNLKQVKFNLIRVELELRHVKFDLNQVKFKLKRVNISMKTNEIHFKPTHPWRCFPHDVNFIMHLFNVANESDVTWCAYCNPSLIPVNIFAHHHAPPPPLSLSLVNACACNLN